MLFRSGEHGLWGALTRSATDPLTEWLDTDEAVRWLPHSDHELSDDLAPMVDTLIE